MKSKLAVTFAAIGGLVIGAVATNLDRLPLGADDASTAQATDKWMETEEVSSLRALVPAVRAFSEDIKQQLPARNEALNDHRRLTSLCEKAFARPEQYTAQTQGSYLASAGRDLYGCLMEAENIAVAHDIEYDHEFAESASLKLDMLLHGHAR